MDKGFSLVEALVAAALLGSGLVGVASMFAVATRASVDTRDMTSETVMAAQALESFRSTPFSPSDVGDAIESSDAFVRRVRVEPYVWDPVDTQVIHVDVWRKGVAQGPGTGAHLSALKTRTGL